MGTVMERSSVGLGNQELFDIPVDRNILFSDHNGRFTPRIEKRQTALVGKLAFLKPFLKDDEKIILVTTGCSPMSTLEQMVTGWIVYYVKRSVLVFTNMRILHIPAKSNFSYRNSIARINYSDCQNISLTTRYLDVRYKNGTREKFMGIDRREGKKIKALLATTSFEGAHAATGGRTHLCPRCTAELVKDRYTCQSCGLVFRNIADGRRISIIYPGGGYFYTGHPVLGTGDAITELILIVFAVAALFGALRGNENGFLPLAIWGTALIVEKAISVYHSNHFIKEYIPEEETVKALGGIGPNPATSRSSPLP